jgi:hypothetical protein
MTTAFTPISFVPAPRPADPEPEPQPQPAAAAPPPAPALHAVPNDAPPVAVEDNVVLPRHIAEAAYNVLQAIQALKDDGGVDLFRKLGDALDKKKRAHALSLPPCDACHIDVGQGLPHHPECWSDEAVRYRGLPLPQVDPFD